MSIDGQIYVDELSGRQTMRKGWIGNVSSVFNMLGASNHSAGERADLDYYATDPAAVVDLLERPFVMPGLFRSGDTQGRPSLNG